MLQKCRETHLWCVITSCLVGTADHFALRQKRQTFARGSPSRDVNTPNNTAMICKKAPSERGLREAVEEPARHWNYIKFYCCALSFRHSLRRATSLPEGGYGKHAERAVVILSFSGDS